MNYTFRSVRHIVCEAGGLLKLGALMKDLNASRVLIVCDPGIVTLGFADTAKASLAEMGIAVDVFSDVAADPPVSVVLAAVERARAFKADGVIGIGGGSSLDTAKLVALMINSTQPIEEMYGTNLAKGARVPLIQVPTTAGTGSEVTWVSVVTDAEGRKKAIYAPQLLPDVALLDPELTLGLPPRITAATGLDAMVHAIEAFTSRTSKNLLADALAVKALQLLSGNIRTAVKDGKNVEARAAMLQGSLLAGMAFVNASVAAIHAMAYPLGARYHVPHGHSNAIVMAPIMRFNLPVATPLYAELARQTLPGRAFASDAEAAEALVADIEALVPSTGLEIRMRDLGVPRDAIPSMAEEVDVGIRRLIACNARDMTRADIQGIYESVY
ncbi:MULTISPECIES: iron-containing alcohol dehydrogenase [unclassified Xanthobacter]|uniref:iron-containing alcohol dehydrogenase n=1 Tax=unclassified Xanthobacter TaxID=2623496 RepID=UPI001F47EF62|nr:MULTISPECIES: iron-containing alcohol dehydrogenase [unclassified Xanthobacter]